MATTELALATSALSLKDADADDDDVWIKRDDFDLKQAPVAETESVKLVQEKEKERSADDQPARERCADIRLYLVNYSFLVLFYISQNVYNIGVIRTLERKFGLRSAQSGLIMSMNDISHILVIIFVGYFGKKAHKPHFLSVSVSLSAIAALMMASPYFIFGNGVPSSAGNVSHIQPATADRCDPERAQRGCTDEEIQMEGTNMAAYYILLAAQFLSGIGGSGVTTLGFSYIDENSEPHKSAMYIGIVTSVMSFGPVASLGLAAFCLKLPENPTEVTDLKPGDPQWIGCWWLGYIVCCVGLVISCIPMWFFPKHIIKAPQPQKQIKKSNKSPVEHLKEFPKDVCELMKNIPFLMFVLVGVLNMYVVIGLYSNLPRYVELHFFKPAFVASFIALSGAVAGVFGSLLGGFIVKKKKLVPKDSLKVVIFGSAVMCAGIAVGMSLICPQPDMAGHWQEDGTFSVETACNSNCSCPTSRKSYQPVCGEDQLTYFSPCHAGCRSEVNGTFTDCGCVMPDDSSRTVRPGKCPIECNKLPIFMLSNFILSLAGSVSRAPATIVLFRVVGDEQRAFGLAISSFVSNLLGCMPAPVLIGMLIDSTCMLWETKCEGTGSCLLYDIRKFRLAVYGSGVTFDLLSFLCVVIIFFLIKDKDFANKKPTA